MSAATHRAALVALISAVPDAGRVHDYQRFAREDGAFRAHYVHTLPGGAKQLRGWQISRVGVDESLVGVGRGLMQHAWVIRGYMALDDAAATELAFDALVEAIRAAFRADPTLGGLSTAEPIDGEDGIQMSDAGAVMFCGVLCHSALLTLKTREYV
jgi:hypothetical protein